VEEEMLAKAATGELVDCEGPYELADMQRWGQKRTVRAAVLRQLLIAIQEAVDAKGVRLRGVLISGQLNLEAATLRCPLFLDYCYLDAIEPVRLNHATLPRISLTQCQLAGLTGDMLSTREIDLSGSTLTGPLTLSGADIAGQLICSGAHLNGRDGDGNALVAERLKAGGNVLLRKTDTTAGAIRLLGADIGGSLICSGARLNGTDGDRNALVADMLKVGDEVHLHKGFTAAGAIRLPGADIGGALGCSGARLTHADRDGNALVADQMKVGAVFLDDKFTTAGTVRLVSAEITTQLRCRDATLTGRDKNGNALHGERMKVGGGVLFDKAFITFGAVCLLSADIAGQLSCGGAHLNGRDKDRNALHGDGIKVGSDLYLNDGFIACGNISLASAKAGSLRWAPGEQIRWRVDLEGADVAQLEDAWTEPDGSKRPNGHWPTSGRLHLDGFTYRRFIGKPQATVEQRLEWIQSQYRPKPKPTVLWAGVMAPPITIPPPDSPTGFATQPYEQLATVYRQAGQGTQARWAAIAQRVDLRKYGDLSPYRKAASWFLDKTIKYGYQTWRAAVGLAIVFVAFLILSWWGQHHHMIVPVGKNMTVAVGKNVEALNQVPSATHCTSRYPCFYPAGYAVDTVIPIIKVGQAQYWRADGNARWGWAFVISTWIATGFGWALATLLVTGYTALVRKE
jgi:hypothetical protein